ncbi:DUF2726 domain-containing protein [Sporosarcina sp. ANT_H38]|uniref:DUF2726 domain-containing protein n=1 Tax=Sporosarcina sp. ANT_H38 TaxID=2597358 RepID=UPI0011F2F861|nr:DUF2726 domain-containing protein [Sporosarcina sp. ANT_H38]KAA0965829.1 DUF2726 domain-containing protein [Sporosarcina sp. ANT_H38]
MEQVQGFVARHGVTLLSEEYLNCKTELLFRCECGKEFETTFDYMKNGSRIKCFVCQPKEGNLFSKGMDTYNKKTHKKFISDFALKQDGEYEILGEYIDCKTGIATKHNCGYVWYPKPDKLLNSENRCPECYSHRNSHLTNDIQKWLDEKSVIYEKEYWFEDCRNQKPLPFDFAVFENDELKMLIEADGQQHFEPFRYIKDLKKREESFRLTRKRDSIKNEYCKKNSIPLLRIPYFDIDNVNEILSNAMLIPSQASENK